MWTEILFIPISVQYFSISPLWIALKQIIIKTLEEIHHEESSAGCSVCLLFIFLFKRELVFIGSPFARCYQAKKLKTKKTNQ